MTRYVALLRGVSPTNADMAALRRCFETAGFAKVRTVLASGNVVFDAAERAVTTLEQRAEAAMQAELGRAFYTIVRRQAELRDLLASDPYAGYALPAEAKRVVSFMREAVPPKLALPLSADGATVCCALGREAYTAYLRSDKGPVFMKLIETAFGSNVTTRTWETIRKCSLT